MKKNVDDLISVIVAIYNIESYIGMCIESILFQTYKHLEVILVDDGSTDNSGSICDRYAKDDGRIRVIHKQNGGLSDARNYGLDIATGRYVGFVDGDDWIHPQMYEILASKMIAFEADICTCWFERENTRFDEKRIDSSELQVKVLNGSEAITDISIPHVVAWNKLYRIELFDGIRYPKGKVHEDEFVIHRIFYKCNRIVVIDSNYPMYFYRDRDDSIINTRTEKHILDALCALEDRVEFAIANNWKEVIPEVVKRYCDYCIDTYMDIKRKKIKVETSILPILWNNERRIVLQHACDFENKYVLFANDAPKYIFKLLLIERINVIKKIAMELGHRIKVYFKK